MNYEALERVKKRLLALSPEELRRQVEKHRDGDIAKILRHSGFFEARKMGAKK